MYGSEPCILVFARIIHLHDLAPCDLSCLAMHAAPSGTCHAKQVVPEIADPELMPQEDEEEMVGWQLIDSLVLIDFNWPNLSVVATNAAAAAISTNPHDAI